MALAFLESFCATSVMKNDATTSVPGVNTVALKVTARGVRGNVSTAMANSPAANAKAIDVFTTSTRNCASGATIGRATWTVAHTEAIAFAQKRH